MLMKGGGIIINISSLATSRIIPGAIPYTVSKSALDALTRSLAVAYGRSGIDVIGVNIGSIPGHLERIDLRGYSGGRRSHPISKPGTRTLEKYAEHIKIIASQKSGLLNGQNIILDQFAIDQYN